MTTSNSTKKKEPLITYQFVDKELENSDKLNRAFDILFEEVLKEKDDLTTMDN
ncbi:MAG: hypothetical protein HOE19_01580 [Candidatus Komeilibacteria bacterium]|jgi:hypothetical protein|nr:hypothetical protein [Candidatus Komeilibacteria bacterium]MBT4447527.1 hypothetical protein [Candidatus Komeilibacteria bacterium]